MHQCQAKSPNEPVAKNEITSLYSTPDVKERITKIIQDHPLVIFMKGNMEAPRCGFSANSCMILNDHNANFHTYDILKDPELRQAIKEYSDWPTFPQIYLKGTLIGGNDILTELAQNGELKKMLA